MIYKRSFYIFYKTVSLTFFVSYREPPYSYQLLSIKYWVTIFKSRHIGDLKLPLSEAVLQMNFSNDKLSSGLGQTVCLSDS